MKIFPQIGWAVPQCLWPVCRHWPPMMSFKHELVFLRCNRWRSEQATDITSSMQCSPFLSAWPTSAPEIAALWSLLTILFCYFIAPATALETGGGKEESVAQERRASSSPLLPRRTSELLRTQSGALRVLVMDKPGSIISSSDWPIQWSVRRWTSIRRVATCSFFKTFKTFFKMLKCSAAIFYSCWRQKNCVRVQNWTWKILVSRCFTFQGCDSWKVINLFKFELCKSDEESKNVNMQRLFLFLCVK